jgi:hypothetical protein
MKRGNLAKKKELGRVTCFPSNIAQPSKSSSEEGNIHKGFNPLNKSKGENRSKNY